MFCRVCGTKMEEGDIYCPKCGWKIESLNSAIEKKKIPEVRKNNGANKKIDQKTLKKMVVTLGTVAVFILIIFFIKGGVTSSPEKVALAATKYNWEGKIDKYYKLLSPQYKKYVVGVNGWFKTDDEFKEELLDTSKDHIQEVAGRCGEKNKIDYKTVHIHKYDKDELDSLQGELSRNFKYDPNSIQAAAEVTVSIDASGIEGKSSWTTDVGCVKVGGKWYVHRPGF